MITKQVNAAFTRTAQWESIDWDQCRTVVKKLQVRIAKATRNGNWRKVNSLQWILTHSYSAKCLALRKVLQNKGRNTPGVDGEILSSPKQKSALVSSLKRRGYRAKPLRRIYIPKSDGRSKRPLSIPTMKDRTMQMLHAMALVPVAETTADISSYGFRQERSCADAIEQCFNILAKQMSPHWVMEGDIKGCFDNISHQWVLNNIPTDKKILAKWLKAGYIETKKLFPTHRGTPQGGIISPVISNMVLDGIVTLLKTKFGNRPIGINLVRYADDFIVTAKSRECLEQQVKPLLMEFLKERGLELSLEKTKITHITDGFNFLGQNVRKYPNGRVRNKLLIKPSKDNIKTFLANIRKTIQKYKTLDQVTLIKILNPKIRGWANYHRHIVSKEIFSKMDSEIWRALWKWSKRRHPNKSANWIMNKYFHRQKRRNYCFSGEEKSPNGKKVSYTLTLMSDVPIRRHVKIKNATNPFDPEDVPYFERRKTAKMKLKSKGRLLAKQRIAAQHGKCSHCGEKITCKHNWQLHLLKSPSNGGTFVSGNLSILHDQCHRNVYAQKTESS